MTEAEYTCPCCSEEFEDESDFLYHDCYCELCSGPIFEDEEDE